MAHNYRLKSTGFSSARYGNCEICDKPASEVFLQVEEREYTNPITNIQGWTRETDCFGHKHCLESKQKG